MSRHSYRAGLGCGSVIPTARGARLTGPGVINSDEAYLGSVLTCVFSAPLQPRGKSKRSFCARLSHQRLQRLSVYN